MNEAGQPILLDGQAAFDGQMMLAASGQDGFQSMANMILVDENGAPIEGQLVPY